MVTKRCFALLLLVVAALPARAADLTASLKEGTPDLQSAGPLAFGPEGILFVGDTRGAAIFAIDTGDKTAGETGDFRVPGVNEKVAALLGTEAKQILINDMAVNPLSGNAYFSVARGRGPDALPAIVRVDRKEKVEEVALKNVKFAKTILSGAAEGKRRQESITHLAFSNGRVFVAGLSNEDFASQFRVLPFPFADTDKGTTVEFYHGSHGRYETNSPVRTFAAMEINGEAHLLAAYTCTPLVKIPVAQLKPGERVKGVTVAELGNMNRPLDMVPYTKAGKNYILMANSSRGVMKVDAENIDKVEAITKRVPAKAGLSYETIPHLKGVLHLAPLDKDHALLLVKADSGVLNLESVELP